MRNHPYYKRSWMFIWVPLSVVLATVIGTQHTYSEGILYRKIGLNLLTGLSIWLFYYYMIIWLDKRMPWLTTNRTKRWILQLGICLPIGAALDLGGVLLRNDVLQADFSTHIFIYTDLPILVLFSILVHIFFYQSYMRYHQDVKPESTQKEDLPNFTSSPSLPITISVKQGKTNHVIPLEDIAYFYRQDEFNFLRMWDGKELFLNQSLSSVEQSLPSHLFFRINRQLLANRQAISSYKVLKNRQTQLELSPPLETRSLLNKNRLASFKQWLTAE